MAEIDDEINEAVERLSKDYLLSSRAKRLTIIFFEIILFELMENKSQSDITVKTVERFMRRVAEFGFSPGIFDGRRLGRLRFPNRQEPISASDLLHLWDFIRRRNRFRFPSDFVFEYRLLDLSLPDDRALVAFLDY